MSTDSTTSARPVYGLGADAAQGPSLLHPARDGRICLGMSDLQWIHLVWLVAALILVGPAVLRRGLGGRGLVYAALWLGIALLIGLLYSVFVEPSPGLPPSDSTRVRTASVAL